MPLGLADLWKGDLGKEAEMSWSLTKQQPSAPPVEESSMKREVVMSRL